MKISHYSWTHWMGWFFVNPNSHLLFPFRLHASSLFGGIFSWPDRATYSSDLCVVNKYQENLECFQKRTLKRKIFLKGKHKNKNKIPFLTSQLSFVVCKCMTLRVARGQGRGEGKVGQCACLKDCWKIMPSKTGIFMSFLM